MFSYEDKERVIGDEDLPKSIRAVARMYPSNQVNRQHYGGLPHLGNALWGSWSSQDIQNAANAYDDYSLSTNLLINGHKPPMVDKVRLGGGSPARFDPFKDCIEGAKMALKNKILSDYPLAAGDYYDKESIIDYFRESQPQSEINEDNIIFTHSSTQGFTLAVEAILDYGDVVIMTAPNYGLFSFIPERVGGRVRLLELTNADSWKVNPNKLKKLIEDTNNQLKIDYDRNRGKYIFRRSDTPPKVTAFLNINPHNPTGIVYGEKDLPLLKQISEVCMNEGVFVVDDLAYSGLEYDRENTAKAISTIPGHFNNTISLYTLSKAYGLAGLRAGLVISNEVVSSLIRDRIFQLSDSLSVLQSSAISAIFKGGEKLRMGRENYFMKITKEYYKRYVFVKSVIEGVKNLGVGEKKVLERILTKNSLNIEYDKYMDGINGVKILIEPESGFFILLDLSKLIGRLYKGFKIVDDRTLLQFLYTSGNIKVLTGKAFCWINPNQLVIRATTAFDYKLLFKSYLRLKRSIETLR